MAASYFYIQASHLPKKFNVSIQEIFDTMTYIYLTTNQPRIRRLEGLSLVKQSLEMQSQLYHYYQSINSILSINYL